MKRFRPILLMVLILLVISFLFAGCDTPPTTATSKDVAATMRLGDRLAAGQPTPTDIDYSLERYNLIRRTYWVNGMRDRANAEICPVPKPLGYIVLFLDNAVVGRFMVDGKVSSLNSFLTPDSEYFELISGGTRTYKNDWLPDVDGSYGVNDNGIFFFTPNGNYLEWNYTYLYTDVPFEVEDPILKMEGLTNG